MLKLLFKILPFILPSPTAIKGTINTSELVRIAKAAILSGAVATAAGLVYAIQSDLPNIVTDPALAGTIGLVLGFVLDYLRRLGHGSDNDGGN